MNNNIIINNNINIDSNKENKNINSNINNENNIYKGKFSINSLKNYNFNNNICNIIPNTKNSNNNNNNSIKKRGNSEDPKKKEKKLNLEKNEDKFSNLITQQEKKKSPKNKISNNQKNTRLLSLSPTRTNISYILPPKTNNDNKKTLVLDLDETLVHSGFSDFNPSDIILPIQIDDEIHNIHVLIRPGVNQFLSILSKFYEIIIFTASLSKYASPLLDIIDRNNHCCYRFYREHCTFINGIFVKDLKRLNRDLKNVIIVDNSPLSYAFNHDNGFPVTSWYDDKNDRELLDIIPILEFLSTVKDVRKIISKIVENNEICFEKVEEIIKNEEINNKNNANNNNVNNNSFNNKNENVKEKKICNSLKMEKKALRGIKINEEINLKVIKKNNCNNSNKNIL